MELPEDGLFVGRVWRTGIGPSVVTVRRGRLFDVTSRAHPTLSALVGAEDIAGACGGGEDLGPLAEWEGRSREAAARRDGEASRLLAPCDLQAVKACGVTFARSMVERVIEERAGGDPARADAIRARVAAAVGERLRDLVPGSPEAGEVARLLRAEGLWCGARRSATT